MVIGPFGLHLTPWPSPALHGRTPTIANSIPAHRRHTHEIGGREERRNQHVSPALSALGSIPSSSCVSSEVQAPQIPSPSMSLLGGPGCWAALVARPHEARPSPCASPTQVVVGPRCTWSPGCLISHTLSTLTTYL